ncbi:MAG: tRNA 4-thiouridine(8) synthase ThiI [Lachnospiraceae bacterium]|jgi:thiamine biosynthesis protein ThiI|nr:tRNA 4-thiouridine(8) synthase ThiI [Lachnospiraceae bacterium]
MAAQEELFHAFLIKYAEIGIKGKNRYLFEDALIRQIRFALRFVEGEFFVRKEMGRIYVEAKRAFDYDEVIQRLGRVFGISGICPMVQFAYKEFADIKEQVLSYVGRVHPEGNFTFKVMAKRANKGFPMDSNEINAALGEAILEAYPSLKVNVHEPDVFFYVEVRERVNLYSKVIAGPGGMPVGTSGKAMLLLSGGIDSPVAGYMTAKRGVSIDAVYFHAPPYTSERAKQKVVDLAKLVSRYSGPMKLHVINFTDIQLYIYDQCPHEELTIIMRRYMMRIAEAIAKESGALALVTGESIGQVASQTLPSLACTGEVCNLPVIRPVIGFDKQEIVDIALKIDTFETSIQPFEDCCTIFVAKHPVIKPNRKIIRRSEEKLAEKIEGMVRTALETREILEVKE